MSSRAVLDATCGGKHIWHDEMKDAGRVVFLDRRVVESGELEHQPGWSVQPDIKADFRNLPFSDGSFDLVCFDPPHRIDSSGMEKLSGVIMKKYGSLHAETWQRDLVQAFSELWRVLSAGGVLTMKWDDESKPGDKVLSLIDESPLYGVNTTKGSRASNWWVFHKHD